MHTPLGGTWNEEIYTHIRTTKIVTQFPEVWPGSARSAALSFVVSLWLELGQRYRCWVSSCRSVWGSVWMMIHIIYLGTYVGTYVGMLVSDEPSDHAEGYIEEWTWC